MNLPNKLTLLRVILVPVFAACYMLDWYAASLVVFALASITDALDGHIARKYKLITDFGKFLDPLADKILVISALICFVDKNVMSGIPLIIIVAREFMVSGLRLVVADEGVVVPASIWGKLKTAVTMITIISGIICAILLQYLEADFYLALDIGIWISTILTVISGLEYLKAYWKYIDSDK